MGMSIRPCKSCSPSRWTLDAAVATSGHSTARKLLNAVEEFHTYIENNKGFIPNYGERYRAGEPISTGFVESTVKQVISKRFCKKQQMVGRHAGRTCCCRSARAC
jgi:hypothetical protein